MQRSNILLITMGLFIMFSIIPVSAGIIAQCVSKFESVAIITDEAYAINDPIPPIRLEVTGNVPLNLPYDAFLYKDTTEGSIVGSVRGGRMSNGTATLDFEYTPLTSGELVIVLIAGENEEIREEKIIEVKRTFDLKLFCPITNNFINTVVQCTWTPTDVTTNQIIPIGVPIATWTQGGVANSASIIGNVMSFVPVAVGSVTIDVAASSEGYVDDVNSIIIDIQDAGIQQEFLINGNDFYLLSDVGIDTGNNKLVIRVREGGQVASVRGITAAITTPSGQTVPIIFVRSGDEWQSSFNFQQPGQKYILKGNIEFDDIQQQPIPFNYDVLTLSAQSEKEKSIITTIIIWVSVALFVIISLVVFVLVRRGRKKNV